ncbi:MULTISPECIES: Rossmann-like and DUF2520 domain-containing protein [Flavobacterium]|uniref:DUF2520 domain-containing protein n=2 Tax=Flavobacterium TaxID=237 RepID=A0AA94F2R9_9FLAO|nr:MULTISPECIES: Rossmann-like and DUF2520 domain-containing protein [Flavobacterium]OXA83987.1 hypothetical protein B0A56_00135 [Flavobacterium columnare NBRC 100251 = ATCC 23463]AMA48446.1 hypothetical protein AWN65_02705 [Flavobacterium covae]MCH4830374.1 DUF2520 domain-containing protein [Flavobacterium columnare]MCH4833689.1 DUF2520 domain-containing protein [Flavobacterium columnare]MCJ1806881.1 F420-dependent NADP oxidoreductase [Flavobacterium covae]
MTTVVILGSGNVASHLINAFLLTEEIKITQVYTRNTTTEIPNFKKENIVHTLEELKEADIYILSVSDTAVHSLAEKIPFQNKLIVHTSGTLNIQILPKTARKGVFYPLQTFSKNKPLNFQEIPICIEAESDQDYFLLEKISQSISNHTFKINSDQRKSLHVSAVFVCNFVNHLYQIGHEICMEHKVPFEILYPLIKETANKIKQLNPKDAQTGPAKRKDSITINEHLHFLQNDTHKEIYKLLTKSIIDNV